MNLPINLHRITTYIRLKHAIEPSRFIRLSSLSFAGLCALIFLLSGVKNDGLPDEVVGVYGLGILILAVVVLGRHTFNEFKNPLNAVGWLTLPASTEEKWIANFLVSFLIAPLVYIVAVTLGTAVVKVVLIALGWNSAFETFNPFSANGLEILTSYWFMHPIFFFGAIYFNKSVVMKTSAMMAIVIFGLLIYTMIVGWLLLPDFVADGFNMHDGELNFELNIEDEPFLHNLSPAWIEFGLKVLFYGSFLYFWVLSYLRLKEVDV